MAPVHSLGYYSLVRFKRPWFDRQLVYVALSQYWKPNRFTRKDLLHSGIFHYYDAVH